MSALKTFWNNLSTPKRVIVVIVGVLVIPSLAHAATLIALAAIIGVIVLVRRVRSN